MKPIKLKIQGLNSFIEPQTIDFKTLTDKGLFGIFGPTGSGKSTILDAITIALYGEIVRKNKDFINTNCDTLIVEYEFEIGRGSHRKSYQAQRNLRRDKHGSIKTRYARLMIKEEDEWMILAEKPTEVRACIERIIGLTIEDFTRSVVLPQGKFSEFLKLKGREKRDMLERIFALEDYGKRLIERIRKGRNECLKVKSERTGQLKAFEGVSKEEYKKKEILLKQVNIQEKELLSQKKEIENQYEQYKEIFKYQQERNEYEKHKKSLQQKEVSIKKIEQQCTQAEKAQYIKPYIDEVNKLQNEKLKMDEKVKASTIHLQQIEKNIEDTQKEYEQALEKKDQDLPKYIEKDSELKNAIEMEEKVKKIIGEREALAKEYEKFHKQKKEINTHLTQYIKSIEELKKELDEKEKQIETMSVSSEYKEEVEKGQQIQKEYIRQKKEIESLEVKIKKEGMSLSKEEKDYEKIEKKRNKIKIELEKMDMDQKNIEKKGPKDPNILLNMQQMLTEQSQELEKVYKNIQQRDEWIKAYEKMKGERVKLENEMKTHKDLLKEKQQNKDGLKKEIENFVIQEQAFRMAKDLKEGQPCPVCGCTHHKKVNVQKDHNQIDDKTCVYEKLEKDIEILDQKVRKLESDYVYVKKEESRFKEEINTIEDQLKGVDIKDKSNIYDQTQQTFLKTKESIESYHVEKEQWERKNKELKELKNQYDQQAIGLKSSIESQNRRMKELREEFDTNKEKVEGLKNQYENLKKHMGIDDFEQEYIKMKQIQTKIQSLHENQKKARKILQKLEEQKDTCNNQLSPINEELKTIIALGQEKRQNIEEQQEKIHHITQGKDAKQLKEETQKSIDAIQENVKNINQKLESQKKEKEILKNLFIEQSEYLKNQIKLIKERSTLIENLIKEYELEDEKKVIEAYMKQEDIEKLKNQVNDFKEQWASTKENIKRVNLKLGGKSITEEQWQHIQQKKQTCTLEHEEKMKQMIQLDTEVEKMKKDLEKCSEIQKKYHQVEHDLSLFTDIEKLVQGNKFVEFVAMNQLKYIAKEASRRLKSITSSRYALEIDDEGNFTVRDDQNGGVIRETASLSGGETFLTSFALALALSSQIQLKGSAPLEFFFLDEGFGTLDANLLEVVMNSLENLHTDQLSVGIISHVEELKNRVPIKLMIKPAEYGQRGSLIKLEYS